MHLANKPAFAWFTNGKFLFKSLFNSGGSNEIFPPQGQDYKSRYFQLLGACLSQQAPFSQAIVHLAPFNKVKVILFDAPKVCYGIIYSHKFLCLVRIDLSFTKNELSWYEVCIPFHPLDYFKNKEAMHQILKVDPI
jgi:hypothetical protein